MYTVTFGGGLEAVTISDESGAHLAKLLEAGEVPEYVVLKGRTIRSTLIRAVESQEVERAFSAQATKTQINRDVDEKEWREDWKKRHALPPAERATVPTIVSLVWEASTGSKEIPEDVLGQIRARSEQYFKENPYTSYANPACYFDVVKPHMREVGATSRKEIDAKPIKDIMRVGIMDLVDRMLQRDISFGRKVEKYGFDNVRL